MRKNIFYQISVGETRENTHRREAVYMLHMPQIIFPEIEFNCAHEETHRGEAIHV